MSPMDDAFAVTPADREGHPINVAHWRQQGAWRHRQFSTEVQLRNSALPHLALDLFRSEAEDLYAALGDVLSRPMPMPFRLSAWQRFRQWWQRKVWNRRHYAELQAAREQLVEYYERRGPWAT